MIEREPPMEAAVRTVVNIKLLQPPIKMSHRLSCLASEGPSNAMSQMAGQGIKDLMNE